MSRRMRLTLLVIGLLLIFCSLVTLSYVYWPLQDGHLQSTLAPTLFMPP